MKPLLALMVVLVLAACGNAEEVATTECRTDANGRQICTTYITKEGA